ncbi:MAG: ABC transporter permease [Bacteroidales bacterium]|jgi:putative ABC transport system permease protein|nr:ABC transporter permease [Bacteroidales bacterium]MDX9927065.1 FtsX-like permease family protein [Bacteroidales bacterium]
MNTFKLAFRPLFRKGEHTVTRIISLSAGLAFGILLIAEVLYYYSYDSFYPDAGRIYVVHENFRPDKSSEDMMSHPRVSGAIGPGLKAEVPGIEAACRLNSIGTNVFYAEDLNSYEADVSLSDEFLFDVLPRQVVMGNPAEILKTPLACMVSEKIAKAIGGDVIGKVITLKRYPDKKLTIAGVFKELPENTNYHYDLLISMVSTKHFTWDGTDNWMGNDRYYTCVKLEPGAAPESLAPAVRKMQEVHQDIVRLETEYGGSILKYSFLPIRRLYSGGVTDMIIILSTIAIAVLFVSLMNYILLTLSALVTRAKSSAIHKTFGAQARTLQLIVFVETLILFFISMAGAVLIIAALKPVIESQLGHSIAAVMNPYVILPLLAIVTLLVLITGWFPGRFFSRIPVATVFRSYKQKNNRWKLALLFVQFAGASFILTLMIFVTLQFGMMKNADHGYNVDGVYYGSTVGMDGNRLQTILNELRALPEVENVGLGYGLPLNGASGNNVRPHDGQMELFNVADFYEADENFLSILDIKVSAGQNFSPGNTAVNDIVISEKGSDMLKMHFGWTDGVVGKQIHITEHGSTTVCGVFPDFIINSIAEPDTRPAVFFYLPEERFVQMKIEKPASSFLILVKVREGLESGMKKEIADVMNLGMPQKDATVRSLEEDLENMYNAQKGFRNALMAGNAVILVILVIGLLGYTTSEAGRHQKELAVRKISGATTSDILKVFILELEYIAIPSVLAGLIGVWFTVDKWMQNFAVKVPMHWGLFVLCSLAILFSVALVAAVNYYRFANRNPVEALRYE